MAARFTKPYVDALLDVAGSLEAVEALLPGLETVAAALGTSEELRALLRNPAVERARKEAILSALDVRAGLAPLGQRFTTTLLHNGRIGSLPEVVRALRERLDREGHIEEATVTSAAPLTTTDEDEIRGALEKVKSVRIRLHNLVDPGLLGGFVVKIGSEIYDASLANRLERARAALHAAGGSGAAAPSTAGNA